MKKRKQLITKKYFLYFFVLVLIIIGINSLMNHYLNYYMVQAKKSNLEKDYKIAYNIINDDIQNILNNNFITQDSSLISNVYHKHDVNFCQKIKSTYSTIVVHTERSCVVIDLSNVYDFLERIYGKDYYYNLMLNGRIVAHNNTHNFVGKYLSLIQVGNNELKLSLEFNQNSEYIKKLEIFYEKSCFFFRLVSCIFILAYGVCLIILDFRRKQNLKYHNLYKKLCLRFEAEKKYILNCYNYSKEHKTVSNGEEYLPLPVNVNGRSDVVSIKISDLLKDIESFFESYRNDGKICHIDVGEINIDYVSSYIDSTTLEQIIVSIIYNLLNFNNNSDDELFIEISCVDSLKIKCSGVKLSLQIAIKASEHVFYQSVNPYILNFKQICGIMDANELDLRIDYNHKGTEINLGIDVESKGNIVKFGKNKHIKDNKN